MPKPTRRTSRRPARWRLADLLDYELMLQARQSGESTPTREEAAHAELLATAKLKGREHASRAELEANRRWWLREFTRTWWKQRPGSGPDAAWDTPGQIVESALGTLKALLMLLGALAGAGVVAGLLALRVDIHDGPSTPVDLFHVLGLWLLPQMLLLLFAAAGMLMRLLGGGLGNARLPRLAGALLAPVARKLAALLAQHTSADLQAGLRAGVGLALGRGGLHRASLGWPLISMLQWAGAAYSLALLLCLGWQLQTRYVPVGWQTSNLEHVTPVAVHNFTSALAAPWAWSGQGLPPTLTQVQETQLIRATMPADGNPTAFVAWWPFLNVTLIFYALIPRLGLLGISLLAKRRALAAERFADSRSDLLLGEIARHLEARALPGPHPAATSSSRPEPSDSTATPAFTPGDSLRDCLVILPPDLDSPALREALTAALHHRPGWHPREFYPVYTVPEQEAFLTALRSVDWDGQPARIAFVERYNSAIVQSLRALVRETQSITGPEGHVLFLLGGKLRFLEEAVTLEQVRYWREYADELKLRHPNTEALPLTAPAPAQHAT